MSLRSRASFPASALLCSAHLSSGQAGRSPGRAMSSVRPLTGADNPRIIPPGFPPPVVYSQHINTSPQSALGTVSDSQQQYQQHLQLSGNVALPPILSSLPPSPPVGYLCVFAASFCTRPSLRFLAELRQHILQQHFIHAYPVLVSLQSPSFLNQFCRLLVRKKIRQSRCSPIISHLYFMPTDSAVLPRVDPSRAFAGKENAPPSVLYHQGTAPLLSTPSRPSCADQASQFLLPPALLRCFRLLPSPRRMRAACRPRGSPRLQQCRQS